VRSRRFPPRDVAASLTVLVVKRPASASPDDSFVKPKFHSADFPVTSATSPRQTRDVPFSPNSITPTFPETSPCRGRHGEVGIVEFGLNAASVFMPSFIRSLEHAASSHQSSSPPVITAAVGEARAPPVFVAPSHLISRFQIFPFLRPRAACLRRDSGPHEEEWPDKSEEWRTADL